MLELQNIHWQLPDGGEILKGISLSIPDGQLTVVTGPNGGGKTSLAKVIAGLYAPSEGKILLNGEDITELSITDRAKRASHTHFSSLSASRVLRFLTCWSFPPRKSFQGTRYVPCWAR